MNGDGVFESSTTKLGTDKNYTAAGLDTPYSDEFTAGVLGDVLGFEYSVEFLQRKSRKGLETHSDDGLDYHWMNTRKSDHNAITLKLAKGIRTESLGNHIFSIGATKSETEKNNNSYDTESYAERYGHIWDYDQAYLNGELVSRSELPPDDFNSSLTVTFGWQGSFFEDSLRLNSITRWKDSTNGLSRDSRLSDDTPNGTVTGSNRTESSEWVNDDGTYSKAYKYGVISGSFITDLGVEWDAYKDEDLTFTMLLNVNNVFDESQEVSVTEGEASRGRSIYAGVRCEF
ncbi:hypothetical protein [Oleidesulfovibrio sp.]|uniref:hypothetical protein n=1 Tax=Oleidesulfovibrio sp. TaxID=2909707 RepID=UPI003A846493